VRFAEASGTQCRLDLRCCDKRRRAGPNSEEARRIRQLRRPGHGLEDAHVVKAIQAALETIELVGASELADGNCLFDAQKAVSLAQAAAAAPLSLRDAGDYINAPRVQRALLSVQVRDPQAAPQDRRSWRRRDVRPCGSGRLPPSAARRRRPGRGRRARPGRHPRRRQEGLLQRRRDRPPHPRRAPHMEGSARRRTRLHVRPRRRRRGPRPGPVNRLPKIACRITEAIAPAFNLTFSPAIWNAGFIVQDPEIFLLVTLAKDDMSKDHRYVDHFVSDREFAWQSQNRTTQASKHGQLLRNHHERGHRVHLFVRPTKKTGSKPTPFVYCGQVDFLSWEGEAPISIRWQLREAVPPALRDILGVPS
jgi:hypothetical protein